MGAETGIAWTDHTFNPWWGCTKVSAGCANCYAEGTANRYGFQIWGDADRRFFGDAHWREPLKWNRSAEREGQRHRVFCASMADVFEDREDLEPVRGRLWDLIAATPWLDWQLLTKRPENMPRMVPRIWQRTGWPDNIWAMTTVEDQAAVKRIPLLRCANARVRGLSIEPLLSMITLPDLAGIHWAILGCESRGKFAGRFSDGYLRAALHINVQCNQAGVALFNKQAPINGLVSHDPEQWNYGIRQRSFPSTAIPPSQAG